MLKKPKINHNHSKRSFTISTLGVKARTVIVVALSCIITIFFSIYLGKQYTDTFDNFITSIYETVNQPIEKLHRLIQTSKECITYQNEKDIILAENQNLKQQNLNLAILEKENTELKKITNYLTNSKFQYITTNIASTSNNSFGLQAMLNVGTENGLSEGQIVIHPNGVVGRIIQVSQKSSKILPWNNPNFKIPVVLLKSGIHCIATGAHDHMELMYLPENIEPIEGEIAITSGEGGIVPYGIKVGEIGITHSQENEFILKPSADLELFSFVSIAISTESNNYP